MVGVFALGNPSSNESLADTLMRIELEVSSSTCFNSVSNERIPDKTCPHTTDRTAFTQGWPIGTNC